MAIQREREREGQRQRQTENSQTDGQIERARARARARERKRERERDRDRDRQTETETERLLSNITLTSPSTPPHLFFIVAVFHVTVLVVETVPDLVFQNLRGHTQRQIFWDSDSHLTLHQHIITITTSHFPSALCRRCCRLAASSSSSSPPPPPPPPPPLHLTPSPWLSFLSSYSCLIWS